MDEVKAVLRHYGFKNPDLADYADHSHDPDMWSHSFTIGDQAYLLVEVEYASEDLNEEEYGRLEEDLGLSKEKLRLIPPKREQMHTMHNQAGIGIDGHRVITNPDDETKYKTRSAWIRQRPGCCSSGHSDKPILERPRPCRRPCQKLRCGCRAAGCELRY